jgi:hypothetical protein
MPTLTLQQAATYARSAGFTGDDLVDIVAVATPESSLSTTVVNSIGCVGVWQINQPVHVRDHPTWTRAWLQDPANNATAAKAIFDVQGMAAWQAWTDGSARAYLPAARAAVAAAGGGTASGTAPGPATQAGVLQDLGGAVAGAVGGTVATGTFLANLTKMAVRTVEWMADPANWVRVIQVLLGGGLVLVGVQSLAKPVIDPIVSAGNKTTALAGKLAA